MALSKIAILITACLIYCSSTQAQLTISGPQCALPGTEYQYNMRAAWNGTLQISVCVEGGTFVQKTDTCISDTTLHYLRIIWQANRPSGKIRVISNIGNADYEVNYTSALTGGQITSEKKQNILVNTVPGAIACSSASGGGCNPQYAYQWQQSSNSSTWTDLSGKTGANLSFTGALTQTTFFRRKTTDQTTGTEAYSDEATVFVNL